MDLYGVRLVSLEINLSLFDKLLRSLINTPAKHIVQSYINKIGEFDPDEEAIDNWCEDYESDGHFGISAVLKDIINSNEGIDVICDDPNGFQYLGIPQDSDEKTKKLFRDVIRKYLIPITDDGSVRFYHYEVEDITCD